MTPNQDIREELLSTINENPGLHFRELQRRSGMATGQLEYHLYQLEREQRVFKRKDGKMIRYFSNESGNELERIIVYYLRNRVSREILLSCLSTKGEIKGRQYEKWQKREETREMIKRLSTDGIIKELGSAIKLDDPPTVLRIMDKFRSSFLDTMASALISLLGP